MVTRSKDIIRNRSRTPQRLDPLGAPSTVDMANFWGGSNTTEENAKSRNSVLPVAKPSKTPPISKRLERRLSSKSLENRTSEETQPPYSFVRMKHNESHLRTERQEQATFLNSTLKFFKQNAKKYNPFVKKEDSFLKSQLDGQILENDLENAPDTKQDEEDENEDPGYAFLTGVNIPGEKKSRKESSDQFGSEVIHDELSDIQNRTMSEENNMNNNNNNFIQRLPDIMHKTASDDYQNTYSLTRSQQLRISQREFNKKSTSQEPKPKISMSEQKSNKIKFQKPSMYISAKANSVKEEGKPMNRVEHLQRIYNKEGTMSAVHQLVNQFGQKRDVRKNLIISYLSNYNVDSLKGQNKVLYEYLNQIKEEQEKKIINNLNNNQSSTYSSSYQQSTLQQQTTQANYPTFGPHNTTQQ